MTKKEAIKILEQLKKGIVEDKQYPYKDAREAVAMAISALKAELIDFRAAGAKGGQIRTKKYSPRDFSKWGKMGGRPPKKKDK